MIVAEWAWLYTWIRCGCVGVNVVGVGVAVCLE